MSTKLIYCADGNKRFADIAVNLGYAYGARLPARGLADYPVQFADQEYKKPNRERYISELAEHKPRIATVLDLERYDQLDEVMAWAAQAARHVTEAVIIIPKFDGAIRFLPRLINGKQVRLGYSVPTSYGGTEVDTSEFAGWPVHLLGGSPVEQIKLSRRMHVVSADTNYDQKIAINGATVFLNRGTKYYVPFNTLGLGHSESDAMYQAFTITRQNMRAAWLQCPAYIRPALSEHVEPIKRIANQYKDQLGFVNRAALLESIKRGTLNIAVIGQRVVGFVNYWHRKDGWNTVYEIAVDRQYRGAHIGAALLESVGLPRQLKCTVDNGKANDFYSQSMKLVRVEDGKKRQLNVWQAA